jgi:hypothetical protein
MFYFSYMCLIFKRGQDSQDRVHYLWELQPVKLTDLQQKIIEK